MRGVTLVTLVTLFLGRVLNVDLSALLAGRFSGELDVDPEASQVRRNALQLPRQHMGLLRPPTAFLLGNITCKSRQRLQELARRSEPLRSLGHQRTDHRTNRERVDC